MILAFLLAAPLAASAWSGLARKRSQMEIANLAGSTAVFLLALALASRVLLRGSVSLWNGFFYADALSGLVILLTAAVGVACSCYAVGYLREDECSGALGDNGEDTLPKLRKYYCLTPLFVFSMLLVAVANNLGVMWAAIELTTLASVFLVTFYGKVTSLEAAWKYAIIGGVGLSMALFGTIVTYYAGHKLPGAEGLTGFNWSVLIHQAGHLDPTSMRLAFVLALLGYGTKAGLAPMHTWKPDAYSEAPVPTAAILSTATLNCALYALMRFYVITSGCLGSGFPGRLLIIFGLASMGVSVPFILIQKNFRRLLAFSTIDHGGIMVTALGLGGPVGAWGLMLHMTFHTLAKSLLFLCAGSVYQFFKTDLFEKIKGGVLRTMPLAGVVFLMATLAIVGMPPFSLFQSEFIIVRAALVSGHYVATALFVVFGVGIFAGALRHVSDLVLGSGEKRPAAPWQPWRDTSLLVLATCLVVVGFWLPGPLLALIRSAARVVGGG